MVVLKTKFSLITCLHVLLTLKPLIKVMPTLVFSITDRLH